MFFLFFFLSFNCEFYVILGYSNPSVINSDIPNSPPPSYEAVMNEVRILKSKYIFEI